MSLSEVLPFFKIFQNPTDYYLNKALFFWPSSIYPFAPQYLINFSNEESCGSSSSSYSHLGVVELGQCIELTNIHRFITPPEGFDMAVFDGVYYSFIENVNDNNEKQFKLYDNIYECEIDALGVSSHNIVAMEQCHVTYNFYDHHHDVDDLKLPNTVSFDISDENEAEKYDLETPKSHQTTPKADLDTPKANLMARTTF
eukprot:Pgem_evm1s9258